MQYELLPCSYAGLVHMSISTNLTPGHVHAAAAVGSIEQPPMCMHPGLQPIATLSVHMTCVLHQTACIVACFHEW